MRAADDFAAIAARMREIAAEEVAEADELVKTVLPKNISEALVAIVNAGILSVAEARDSLTVAP